jgi:hypothetical protein
MVPRDRSATERVFEASSQDAKGEYQDRYNGHLQVEAKGILAQRQGSFEVEYLIEWMTDSDHCDWVPRGWLQKVAKGWGLVFEYDDSHIETIERDYIIKIQAAGRGLAARQNMRENERKVAIVQAIARRNQAQRTVQHKSEQKMGLQREAEAEAAAEAAEWLKAVEREKVYLKQEVFTMRPL